MDSLSSSDMVQTEGSNVTLECLASGSPEPEVVWRREDAREITVDKNNTGEYDAPSIGELFIPLIQLVLCQWFGNFPL